MDIDQINFLYAVYQCNGLNVMHRKLPPLDNLLVAEDGKFDVIYCLTVLEHVPNPDQVVRSFYSALSDDGVLVFDYIKGDGDGLDSVRSVSKRDETLEYIKENFSVLYGHIDSGDQVGFTICRKRC